MQFQLGARSLFGNPDDNSKADSSDVSESGSLDALRALAQELLSKALESMRGHGIPTTPENITVWYHYQQGDIPQLNKEIDKVISRSSAFSASICDQLYKRFFTDVDQRKQEILRTAIRDLIFHFTEHVTLLAEGVNNYQHSLVGFADKLHGNLDEAALGDLIQGLMHETNQALSVTQGARERIDTMNDEIGRLKTTLQDMERSALEDALTSVANRRAFDQVFAGYILDAKEGSDSCALLLIDIDNFKVFNDKYGHQSGDKVLRFVASMLKQLVKGQDFVARYGGEEFAIILPGTSFNGAMALARSLNQKIARSRLSINVGDSKKVVDPVTVSVGVSSFIDEDTPETLFQRADASLYKAKAAGRNRVVGQDSLS